MNIIIHRGDDQIGGNVVEISTDTTKILFDVGLELDPDKNIELPDVEGLFEGKGFDAIFISHYHGDHMGLAYKVSVEIPIYIGEKSFKIIEASDNYKGVRSFKPYGFLKHRIPIKINDLTIVPYLCDHSAFDSYMLLCESKGERILYTGDFRANGRKPFEWLLRDLPKNVDVLICEGTTLSRDGHITTTEAALENEATKLFGNNPGPMFVLQSSMNIDRIVTMYRAAKRTNRIFLQELYMAMITSSIGGSIPNPAFGDVFAFITSPKRYEQLCSYKNRIGKVNIAKSNFVMCVRTSMLNYLRSLSKDMPFDKGALVYSFWDGYKEDESMMNFLSECEQLGLKIVTLHTSGHADFRAIRKLIETVNPGRVVPIHTENSGWFDVYNDNEQ